MSFYNNLKNPFFVLAPMDDVTDTVFRQMVSRIAPPDVYFTEFVNVDGLLSSGRDKLVHKLLFTKNEKPLVAQLWGLIPDNFYKITTEIKQMGFDGVDLNMGCPDKNIVKNGCCSALINNRSLAKEIIEAVQSAACGMPVSIKTRLGFNEYDLSWLDFLLDLKPAVLSVHGRTRKQMSKVPANWDLIGEVKNLAISKKSETLIVGNGDIANKQEGLELANKFNLDGIMIGRGILKDIFAFSENSLWKEYTKEDKIKLFIDHIKLFNDTWDHQQRPYAQVFKFAKLYLNDFEGASELRLSIMQVKKPEEAINILSNSLM